MGLVSNYAKAAEKYQQLAQRAAQGDAQAKADKAKARLEMRQMEREGARNGVILDGGQDTTAQVIRQNGEEPRTKRAMQEEYCRRFDAKKEVMVQTGKGEPYKSTLREFHSKRLLKK